MSLRVCLFRDPVEEVRKAAVEQRLHVSVVGAMGIELQEQIVADRRRQIEPTAHARRRGQIVSGDLAGLQARHQPVAEAEAERSGNHQQVALPAAANRGFDPAIEGPWPIVRMIRAPIDLVDYAPLRRRGKRRHGEIGIAAQIAQQSDFAFEVHLSSGRGVVDAQLR